jgi:poly(3-hydroxyalkanoate) depolymerase
MFTTAEVRSVAVGGRQLRVAIRPGNLGRRGLRLTAPPRRAPLLLINGIGASLELLEPFVRELDPAVDVIRFDPPGVGGSPPPATPYRFTGLCALIAGMLTELGYGQVDVLGISWGGAVAQHFAAFQRSRCRRLVLVATATGALMVPARPSVLANLVTPRRYLDRGYLERVAGNLYGGSARENPGQVTAAMNNGNRVGPSRGYLYQLAAGAGWTSVPFLPLIKQPALIVAGDDDPIIPLANARLMHRLIPNARLHVYHGGHLGLVTEAAQLAPVVDGFLAAVTREDTDDKRR